MGWLRKVTGTQAQIDAANENARRQTEANRVASDAATKQAVAQAKAAAQAVELQAQRAQVAQEVQAAAEQQDVAAADVALADGVDPGETKQGSRKRRQATWGTGFDGLSL